MAVNTPSVAAAQQQQQQQQQHATPAVPKAEGSGSLDALAGFAAQQGKLGNGSHDVEMGDAKKESPKKEGLKEEGRRWVDGPTTTTVNAGTKWPVNVNALES